MLADGFVLMPDKARPASAPAGGYPSHSEQNKEVLAKVQAILISRKEQAARDAQMAIAAGDGLAKDAELKPEPSSSTAAKPQQTACELNKREAVAKPDGPPEDEETEGQNFTRSTEGMKDGQADGTSSKPELFTAKGEYHSTRQPKGELADLD